MKLDKQTEHFLFRVFNILNSLEDLNPIVDVDEDICKTYLDMIKLPGFEVTSEELRNHFLKVYNLDIE